jgi:hypothetical protein
MAAQPIAINHPTVATPVRVPRVARIELPYTDSRVHHIYECTNCRSTQSFVTPV